MKFFRSQSGGVSIIFALILPVAMGLCALTFDLANLRYNQAQLQLAADAGALAGADAISNPATAKSSAAQLAQMNAPQGTSNVVSASDIDLGVYDASSRAFQVTASNPTAVRVKTARDFAHGNAIQGVFTRAVGLSSGYSVHASSIATASTSTCLYALDPSSSGAVQFVGGVTFASSCGFQINSSSNSAITTIGLYTVNVSQICDVGGYLSLGVGVFTPNPTTGCPVKTDPLSTVPEPAPFASCQNSNVTAIGGVLNPGCYAGTITVIGSVTLNPGIYQFQGANLILLGGSILQGDGVMIYLDSASRFTMIGLASINLTAPPSGVYQGIVVFYSRSAANSTLNLIGSSSISLNGTIYAPSTNLTLTGLGAIQSNYGYLIVNRLIATGLGVMKFNAFPSNPRRPPGLVSRSKLVL